MQKDTITVPISCTLLLLALAQEIASRTLLRIPTEPLWNVTMNIIFLFFFSFLLLFSFSFFLSKNKIINNKNKTKRRGWGEGDRGTQESLRYSTCRQKMQPTPCGIFNGMFLPCSVCLLLHCLFRDLISILPVFFPHIYYQYYDTGTVSWQ